MLDDVPKSADSSQNGRVPGTKCHRGGGRRHEAGAQTCCLALCLLDIRRGLGSDGETKRMRKRALVICNRVAEGDGREELGASRTDDARLADLDLDVGDVKLAENLSASEGYSASVFARERLGKDAYPRDDGERRRALEPSQYERCRRCLACV